MPLGFDEVVARIVAGAIPGARVVASAPLGADAARDASHKEAGYGRPLRLTVEAPGGGRRALVLRTALADEFGHDRRADRLEELVLAHDTFGGIPDHVAALDVGLLGPGGPCSLRGGGEPYLLTTFAEGALYAEDLRRVAREGLGALDLERGAALARWLAALHRERRADPVAWRRALRDLVGHGEGILGVVDAYGPDVPAAPPARLEALERRALAWRWALRDRSDRLRRTHGDFHPFNLVFSEGVRFTALDASRGGWGDPADDVTALAVNYVFFALDVPGAWPRGLGALWRAWWAGYREAGGDPGVLESAAPFFAWRALVVCCPRFYPALSPRARDALLGLAERQLGAPRFDPAAAEALFP